MRKRILTANRDCRPAAVPPSLLGLNEGREAQRATRRSALVIRSGSP